MHVADIDTLQPIQNLLSPLHPLYPDQLAHGALPTVQHHKRAWSRLHQDARHTTSCHQEGYHWEADAWGFYSN